LVEGHVPDEWYKRYGRQIEYHHIQLAKLNARRIGEDGTLLPLVGDARNTSSPQGLEVDILKAVWRRVIKVSDQ